jgi:hypothetical protein
LGINPEHLRQAWTDFDPRCSKTFLHTAGSQCYVASLNADGGLYSRPFPTIEGKVTKSNGTTGIGQVKMQMCTDNGSCTIADTTDALGRYSICVTQADVSGTPSWSGTITPLNKTGVTFNTSRHYTNFCTPDLTLQNYAATSP